MSDWDGTLITLNKGASANLPQTANGSMIFSYANMSQGNDQGQLSLVSGGSRPEVLLVDPGTYQYQVIARNWGGNNLKVTNSSITDPELQIATYGPGINPTDGQVLSNVPVQLQIGECAMGTGSPSWQTIRFSAPSATATIFALIGGPLKNGINAYVFGLNFSSSMGPPQDNNPPANGYFQTTTANTIDFQFNWGPSSPRLWVVNMSSMSANISQVTLIG